MLHRQTREGPETGKHRLPGILILTVVSKIIYINNFGSGTVEPKPKLIILAAAPAPPPQNNFGSGSDSATLVIKVGFFKMAHFWRIVRVTPTSAAAWD